MSEEAKKFTTDIKASKEERERKLKELRERKMKREQQDAAKIPFPIAKKTEDSLSFISTISDKPSIESIPDPSIPQRPSLSMKSNISNINVPAKSKVISYEREIQADISSASEDEDELRITEDNDPRLRKMSLHQVKPEPVEEDLKVVEQAPKELEPEELERIIGSPEFGDFLSRTTGLMTESLEEEFDIMQNFILSNKADDTNDQKGKIKIMQFLHFTEEDRCISALEWSPQYEDLILAAYTRAENEGIGLPYGLVQLWSIENAKAPKHSLFCQSSVTQAQFYPNDPNTILGGTYSGQILLWDLRTKGVPVQRSPSLSKGHNFPIIGLAVSELEHTNNIVSMSSDGKVCVWTMNMLHSPMETYETKGKTEISANCVDFVNKEPWDYIIGTEDGNIIQGPLQGQMLSERQDITQAHFGPITRVHHHPNYDSKLILTSSVDWTVKIFKGTEPEPLLTIEPYDDYVYDSKWSPVHPCMFASVDGDGNLDIWDLSRNTETPFVRQNTGNKALNKLNFDRSGHRIAVGSSSSVIHIMQLDKDYAHPRSDDWNKMVKALGL